MWLVGALVRRYIDFLILLILTPLLLALFEAASLFFAHLKIFLLLFVIFVQYRNHCSKNI